MGISLFAKVKWIALQQPLILLASMLTGKPVMEILALEVHVRARLLNTVAVEVQELTASMVVATDPGGEGGVTITEDELAVIIDEADDPREAVRALLDYRSGGEETSATGQ